MLLLPLLTALLGCASAFQPPVPDHECRTLDNVFHAVDTVAEAAVHASASGLVALYVCRRRGGPDCELVGGLGASSAASLFLVLKRVGGTLLSGDNGGGGGGGFGWFSVDDVIFFASAATMSYQLYLNLWSSLASRRTGVWLSINVFQAITLFSRSLRHGLAPGEETRLSTLAFAQTLFCVCTGIFAAFARMIVIDR